MNEWQLAFRVGCLALAFAGPAAATGGAAEAFPQRIERGGGTNLVFKARLLPHWLGDQMRFWYRNDLRGGAKEFVMVDAVQGRRAQAFDQARLAASLSTAAAAVYTAEHLPFHAIQFVGGPGEEAIRFKVGETAWECRLGDYH